MEEIIVFGVGKYFNTKKHAIQERYKISMALDNCVACSDIKMMDGLKVINPSDLNDSISRIFLMSVRFIPMWRQLIELGVDPDRIVFPYDIQPYFENDEAISNGINEIIFKSDYLRCVLDDGYEKIIHGEDEWGECLRELYRNMYSIINAVSSMNLVPVSAQFGTERGTPVDRHYIGKFLEDNQKYITGDVLEIEDSYYTEKYGTKVSKAIVMDVSSKEASISFNANLETGEGVKEAVADCFILTQTLMYLFDLKKAAESIYKLLKPGGVALITCSGISQNSRRCMDDYGCFFNFNTDALKKMFADTDRFEILNAGSHGNVKTVTAHIAGLCAEDLAEDDFAYDDKYYPLITYIVVRRASI